MQPRHHECSTCSGHLGDVGEWWQTLPGGPTRRPSDAGAKWQVENLISVDPYNVLFRRASGIMPTIAGEMRLNVICVTT